MLSWFIKHLNLKYRENLNVTWRTWCLFIIWWRSSYWVLVKKWYQQTEMFTNVSLHKQRLNFTMWLKAQDYQKDDGVGLMALVRNSTDYVDIQQNNRIKSAFFFFSSKTKMISRINSCFLTSWWSDVAPHYPAFLCSAGLALGGGAAARWERRWLAGRGQLCPAARRRGRSTLHNRPRSSEYRQRWNLGR